MDFHYLVTQPDLNAHGTLHGGILTKWIDESCGMFARLLTRKVCVTRHIGNIDFVATSKLGDTLKTHVELVKVGNTSITFSGFVLDAITFKKIADFESFVFVAIDENGVPAKIKQLHNCL